MKKLLIVVLVFIFSQAHAGEGMWLPQLLKALNEGEMQSMGMKLTAEQIYSVNQGSLKDAIVHFGGFCTSELISDKGLLLTNHHCGYGQIQSHSSIEDNYLKNGFWAKDYQDEKANPGLFARFIERIEDVSDEVLKGTNDNMTPEEIQAIVNKNIDALQKAANLDNFHELMIRPFYAGNQYFAFHTVVYRDVRLVGTPPESIGKFGADTDNWVWPRHTGDFSLFRIYANPNNDPSEYSEDNVPFTPKHYLPISLDGVEEGDFTMVFGFPGRTQQYLPAVAVKQIQDVLDPAKIEIRDESLGIMDKYMRKDENAKLKYASKFARIANYWKKWMGERQGLIKSNAVAKKRELEDDFTRIVSNNSSYKEKYGDILSNFEKYYKEIEPYAYARDYYSEITNRNVEVFRIASYMDRLINEYENGGEAAYDELMPRLKGALDNFYKNYDSSIDREVYGELVQLYQSKIDANFVPSSLRYVGAADVMKKFDNSFLNKEEELNNLLQKSPKEAITEIKKDDIYNLYIDWKETYKEKIAKPYNRINGEISKNQKLYMEALMKVFPSKRFWPDANSTMRVTYGQVNGYEPRDAVYYKPKTYLSGVIAKYVPGDYEFDVSDKLLELHRTKDYGQYADATGDVPVCFLGSNHTTGGNSGSPAIDAHGNLIGLNFDRVWEGTMSDINYDKSICRNIMVDIRYVLFIVDKYADAKHLVDEMKLVHPKN